MRIVDRYIFALFARIFLICFLSLTGLYVVIDAFGNLDDFITHGQSGSGLFAVLAQYYGARSLSFFDQISGVLTLIAAVFTATWLAKNNEMNSLLAAGISKLRVLVPIFLAVVVVSALAVVNREFVLPTMREMLSENAQNLDGQQVKPLQARWDQQTDIEINGESTISHDRHIMNPSFGLPDEFSQFGSRLEANSAYYHDPSGDRPGGYLFQEVKSPEGIATITSAGNENSVLLTSLDTPWLKEGECFVVSNVTFEQLAQNSSWRQFASTTELIAGLRNPSLDYSADVRVRVHARLVQPLLDITLLLLGLPIVLSRQSRNVFVAAGLCIGVAAIFFVVTIASQFLGMNSHLHPALAAWFPLILLAPVAAALADPLWR